MTAINFNGEGPASPISQFKPCTAPQNFERPTIVGVSETSITIEWVHPESDGGCEITGYKIYVDDGN